MLIPLLLLSMQEPDRKALQQEEQQERIESLEKKLQELEKRQAQTTSANPETVFNPRITVIGNFLWRLDNDKVLLDTGEDIADTANFREAELDLRAAIDPYADGVCILSVESEVPGAAEIGVEEFLIKIKSLPVFFWETPPLGTQIKIGRMRTEIGTNNLLHLHDLPQADRPLVLEEFFGEEGHISNGASAQMFLPSFGETALRLTLQALQGGGIGVAQDPNRWVYLANLNWFLPLAPEHQVSLSLIGLYGTNDPAGHRQSRVGSVDLWYRWKPLQGGDSASILVGAQLFKVDHEFSVDSDLDGDLDVDDAAFKTSPFGVSAWAQVQFTRPLYFGLRWDRTDFLDNDDLDRRRLTPYVSWYMTEFFRARAMVERTWSDDPADDGLLTFMVEINVVYGAHPTEPFWVNK